MKEKFTTKVLVEIALFAAISFALDLLASGLSRFLFVNGGSFSIAMLPIFILAYRRGFTPALICGITVSLLQTISGVYIVAGNWYYALAQVMLDYILTYPMVALAGIFARSFQKTDKKNKKYLLIIIGCIVGGLGKYLCHVLSGVIFWSSSIAWSSFEGMPFVYSLVYNGAFCLPNIVICVIIMVLIYKLQPQLIESNLTTTESDYYEQEE